MQNHNIIFSFQRVRISDDYFNILDNFLETHGYTVFTTKVRGRCHVEADVFILDETNIKIKTRFGFCSAGFSVV